MSWESGCTDLHVDDDGRLHALLQSLILQHGTNRTYTKKHSWEPVMHALEEDEARIGASPEAACVGT